ncbi:retrovirus-related pol polyprotein from transposon TNT 1-94 [Tanacetum coccineum]
MNKPEVETMSIDDLYNNFKIVEQKVKKSIGASSGAQNLAFMTAPSTSSTNDANTASPQVSTASPNVNTASPQVSTASFSDNVVYAFMVENPNGSNLLHQDLEQIHEDDLEAMDLKWQLSLLSMRAKRYYQRTGKKIFINANDTARYDKSKVECYNCHKLGHFSRECRAPRSKEGQFRNQDNTRKQGNNEDTSSKAMLAIDGVGFDWSDMAEEQCDDLIVKLNQTEFTAATYKRGFVTVEEQLVTYRNNKVLFNEEVAVLKREVACKEYETNVLKSEFEKVKQEKDGIEFKIEKFDKASKDLDQLLGSQITDKSKKGLGYSAVTPPHPLIYNRPKKLDLSYFGLDEFKEPKFKGYGPENKEQVSQDTSSFVESSLNVDKETIFPVNKKIEITKPKNHKKPVKKSVRYFHQKVNTVRPRVVNTARPYTAPVNTVRVKGVNAIKSSAYWVWRPTKPNGASLAFKRHNYIDARGRSKGGAYGGRTTVYSELSPGDKERYHADIRATNILLQGLPKDIYTLIKHYTDAKDIWDNVKMLLESVKLNRGLKESNYDQPYAYLKQHEANANENKMMLERFTQHTVDPLAMMSNVSPQHYSSQSSTTPPSTHVPPVTYLPHFADNTKLNSGLSLMENLIENLTNTLALLTQSYKTYIPQNNNQLRTSSNTRNQATVQDGRVVVQNVQDELPVQDPALNVDNVFQADECNAFDSDIDEAPTTQTMFMANLSSADPVYDEASPSYDSDILSKVHEYDNYHDVVCEHHDTHEMHHDVQPNCVVDSNADYTSDSNMITYDQYVKDNAEPVVQSNVSSVPNYAYLMIINEMHEQTAQNVSMNKQNKVVNASLTAELATYKEQVKLCERLAKFELTKRKQNIEEQLRIVITDRNIKEENLKKELHSVKMQLNSTINHNKLKVEEVTSLKKDFKQKENKYLVEFLDMKALKEKVEDKLYKQDQSLQTVHMLCKPKPYYDEQKKVAIGYKNPLCLTRSKQVHSALYNGHEIIKTNHVPAIVHNSEDTLEIAKITRKKMNDKTKTPLWTEQNINIRPPDYSKENYLATFTPHTQLTLGQIFWSKDVLKMKAEALKDQTPASRPIKSLMVYPPNTPATLIPRVLPTKIQLEAEVDQNVVSRKYDEIEQKNPLIANDNLIADCLSKEVFYIKTNYELTVSRFTEMHDAHTVVQARCLELKAELSKLHDKVQTDDHTALVKHFSNLEVNHLNLQLKYQHLKKRFGNNKSLPARDAPDFDSVFVIEKIKASIQGKDNAIKKLRMQISQLKETRSEADRTLDFRAFNFQITQLTEKVTVLQEQNELFRAENAKIKQHYKELKHSCYVRDTYGVELIKGSCGSNLYTILVEDMMKSSLICLLSKVFKNKSWLWHRRLNHLNIGTINDLARKDLVRGLPRLKFKKDHLCSTCQLGKSKKHTHTPKIENTNLEVLNTLPIDLCGPMRVQTINGKKYILVIIDDYSRFTWVKFLRSKDETPEFVIKFLKQIQVGLNKTVRYVRTDNGTKFVNQVLTEYYESVGIFHHKLVPRTPQQNDIVERRNRTLMEAAKTMLIFSKALMFLWAEAVATACYT